MKFIKGVILFIFAIVIFVLIFTIFTFTKFSKINLRNIDSYIVVDYEYPNLTTEITQISDSNKEVREWKVLEPFHYSYLTQDFNNPKDIYIKNTTYTTENDFFINDDLNKNILKYDLEKNNFEVVKCNINTNGNDYKITNSSFIGPDPLVYAINLNNDNIGYVYNIKADTTYTLDFTNTPITNSSIQNGTALAETKDKIYFTAGANTFYSFNKNTNDLSFVNTSSITHLNQIFAVYNDRPLITNVANSIIYELNENEELVEFGKVGNKNCNIYSWEKLTEDEMLMFTQRDDGTKNLYLFNLNTKECKLFGTLAINKRNTYFPIYYYDNNIFIHEYDVVTNNSNVLVLDKNTEEILREHNLGDKGNFNHFSTNNIVFFEKRVSNTN